MEPKGNQPFFLEGGSPIWNNPIFPPCCIFNCIVNDIRVPWVMLNGYMQGSPGNLHTDNFMRHFWIRIKIFRRAPVNEGDLQILAQHFQDCQRKLRNYQGDLQDTEEHSQITQGNDQRTQPSPLFPAPEVTRLTGAVKTNLDIRRSGGSPAMATLRSDAQARWVFRFRSRAGSSGLLQVPGSPAAIAFCCCALLPPNTSETRLSSD